MIEDVFAYSNRRDDERALVVYHNRFARAAGWIRRSVGFAVKQGRGGGPGGGPAGTDGAEGGRWIEWRTLGDGLGLSDGAGVFYAFRDARTGLEYLRSGRDLCREGMYIELPAYACHVFLDWREVRDGEGRPYGELARSLAGRGVPSIDEALVELRLRPVHEALRAVMGSDAAWAVVESEAGAPDGAAPTSDRAEPGARGDGAPLEPTASTRDLEARLFALLRTVRGQAGRVPDPSRDEQLAREAVARVGEIPALAELPARGLPWPSSRVGAETEGDRTGEAGLAVTIADRAALLAWIVVDALAAAAAGDGGPAHAEPQGVEPSRAAALDTWRLDPVLSGELQELGVGEGTARRIVSTVRALLVSAAIATAGDIASWFEEPVIAGALGVHEWDGATWFDRGALLDLVRLSFLRQAVEITRSRELVPADRAERLKEAAQTARALELACEASGDRADRLLALLLAAGES